MACWVSVSQIDICLRNPYKRRTGWVFDLPDFLDLLQIKDRVVWLFRPRYFLDNLI